MRIVVTGGSGRIGSDLVKHLHESGHDVLCLDIAKPRYKVDVPWRYIELADRATLQPLLEGADAVAHLGEIPNMWGQQPINVYRENAAAGSTVMQTSADLGVGRFLYISTCQIYSCFGGSENFSPPDVIPFDETHPIRPRNAYGTSKAANEVYARMIAETTDMSVAALRFPGVVQPNRWWKRAKHRERPIGDWYEFGTYVTIGDAVELMRLLLENPRPGFEAYHVAAQHTSSPFTIHELADHFGYTGPPIPENTTCLFDCSKLRDHFGWSPSQSIEDVVAASQDD